MSARYNRINNKAINSNKIREKMVSISKGSLRISIIYHQPLGPQRSAIFSAVTPGQVKMQHLVFCVLLSFVLMVPSSIDGHGMLLSPPQRSSMFRFKFNVPPNYNDNGLNCGGYGVSYSMDENHISYIKWYTIVFISQINRSNIITSIKEDVVNAATNGVCLVLDPTMKVVVMELESKAQLIPRAR